jgi:hypothetical protein
VSYEHGELGRHIAMKGPRKRREFLAAPTQVAKSDNKSVLLCVRGTRLSDVLERMTVRAQRLEVGRRVVRPIAIPMVNLQLSTMIGREAAPSASRRKVPPIVAARHRLRVGVQPSVRKCPFRPGMA